MTPYRVRGPYGARSKQRFEAARPVEANTARARQNAGRVPGGVPCERLPGTPPMASPASMRSVQRAWRGVLGARIGPWTAAQEPSDCQKSTLDGAVLADHDFSVTAAGRAEPTLTAQDHAVADDLIRMNGRNEQPTAELVCRRAKEIDSQHEKKHDGDETSSPPSTYSIRVGVRTCRQTR